jgi:hypothetical protein
MWKYNLSSAEIKFNFHYFICGSSHVAVVCILGIVSTSVLTAVTLKNAVF